MYQHRSLRRELCVVVLVLFGMVSSSALAEKCNPADPETCVGGPTGQPPPCGNKDQACCGGYSCNSVDSPWSNDQLSCYRGTCRAYGEFFDTCYGYMWNAQTFGGADPVSCSLSPACWPNYLEYKAYGCADEQYCWWSDPRVPPFVLWAGPHCQPGNE